MPDLWSVLHYEVDMFNGLLALCYGGIRNTFTWPIPNAITESLMLHTRILTCILISRGRGDDIKLKDLLPNLDVPEIETLKMVYGMDDDSTSICWTFNKRLAHATTTRADSDGYDYTTAVLTLRPFTEEILAAVELVHPRLQATGNIAADLNKRGNL